MKINFTHHTWFTGRNGLFNMSGLDIAPANGGIILAPITGKGKIGRCDMCIPDNALDDVIAALQTIKKNKNSIL